MSELAKMPGLREDFPAHTLQEWRASVEKLLEGKSYDKIMLTPTHEGIILKPVYTKEDVENLHRNLEFPGLGSYIRGNEPLGYLQHPWEVSQEISYPTPFECHEALQRDLSRGLTQIHLVCDRPTCNGISVHHAKTEEIGLGGVSLTNVSDWNKLLDGIEIEKFSFFIEAGVSALPITSMLLAYLQQKQKNISCLKGCIGLDPLGELAFCGKLPCSLKELYDEMAMLTKWSIAQTPDLRTIVVSGHPYHNAGADSATELAYMLATSVEYIFQMQSRSLKIDQITSKFQWNISIGSNFFMEIAKLRVARMLWAAIIKELGGTAESGKIYIHARGSSYNKTKYDVHVNMLRSTTESFSAILGGCQSLHVCCFDEALGLPTEFSRRIARNQQLILKEESHLNQLIDPAGGSWYLETLTEELAQRVWKLFQEVAKQSGMYAILEQGIAQKTISEIAKLRRENVQNNKEVLVGVNMYANSQEIPNQIRTLDHNAIQKQRLEEVSKDKIIAITLPSDEEILGLATAFREGANLGQAVQQLRPISETVSIPSLQIHRLAESYEQSKDVAKKDEPKSK